jgi:hypothetical protein
MTAQATQKHPLRDWARLIELAERRQRALRDENADALADVNRELAELKERYRR